MHMVPNVSTFKRSGTESRKKRVQELEIENNSLLSKKLTRKIKTKDEWKLAPCVVDHETSWLPAAEQAVTDQLKRVFVLKVWKAMNGQQLLTIIPDVLPFLTVPAETTTKAAIMQLVKVHLQEINDIVNGEKENTLSEQIIADGDLIGTKLGYFVKHADTILESIDAKENGVNQKKLSAVTARLFDSIGGMTNDSAPTLVVVEDNFDSSDSSDSEGEGGNAGEEQDVLHRRSKRQKKK